MKRAFLAALFFGCVGAAALSAQEAALSKSDAPTSSNGQDCQVLPSPPASGNDNPIADEAPCAEVVPWQSVWGLAGLRVIPAGLKTAPNGEEYHPNFSMDLDLNAWLWRRRRLYLFGDARFWGEKSEYGVTNARDGFFATSKRQFDLSGGAAWNYAGSWEARVSGYSLNNLNRGTSLVTPTGVKDGSCFENRYYLSPEYDKLGRTGFDVARATFLSVGYYPTKGMVGNDGLDFKPGLLLRAYLTYDLWHLPSYAFADGSFLSERSLQPKLFLFDVGLAARPFSSFQQCEFRLGAENTADLQVGNVQSLWYASIRFIF